MALNQEGEWVDPDMNDLVILGTSLIRRHDKGDMTDETIKMYVDGVTRTYNLTEEQSKELTQKLVSRR